MANSSEPALSEAKEPPMTSLPTELLLQVFDLLPVEQLCQGGSVRNVCRRWREVAQSPSVWRRRDAKYTDELSFHDKNIFYRTVAVAPLLRTISFRSGGRCDSGAVLEGCARVRRLNLSLHAERALNKGLAVLRHYSTQTETLRLSVEGTCGPAAGSAILRAVTQFRSLRALKLSGYLEVGQEVVSELAESCSQLEDLDVRDIHGPAGIKLMELAGQRVRRLVLPGRHAVLGRKILEQVASSCTSLTALGADFEDAVFLLGRLPRLRRLQLWYSYSCPEPEVLSHLRRCRRGPEGDRAILAAPESVAAAVARLEQLSVQLSTETEFVVAVLGACRRLRALVVSGCGVHGQLRDLFEAVGDLIPALGVHDDGLHVKEEEEEEDEAPSGAQSRVSVSFPPGPGGAFK